MYHVLHLQYISSGYQHLPLDIAAEIHFLIKGIMATGKALADLQKTSGLFTDSAWYTQLLVSTKYLRGDYGTVYVM